MPTGTIRATVLIETLPAAFQMEEILYELREHSYGLNAGRWDYIFSMIKCFRDDPDFVLPDRNDVKMTVPFMRAYTELLVKTCHAPRRVRDGRHGRADPVAQGRRRPTSARSRPCARTRSARPRPASTAPGSRTRTSSTSRWSSSTRCSATGRTRSTASATTSTSRPSSCSTPPPRPGEITEEGLRSDVSVGFQYISFWLGGRGAAGINNLMEDAATAEISRSQIWQWIRHGKFTREHVREVLDAGDGEDPRRGRRRGLGEGPPGRDARGVRARRARRTTSRSS